MTLRTPIRRYGAALAIALIAATAAAQSIPGAEDPVVRTLLGDGAGTVTPLAPHVGKTGVAGAVTLPRLTADDIRTARRSGRQKMEVVGIVRRFDAVDAPTAPGEDAAVTHMPDGTRVVTLEVSAPGAVGLRVRVCRIDLPAGAEVIVYDAAEPDEAYGPWNSRGPHGTGEFTSPTVFGETARVEVRVAPGVTLPDDALAIDAAVHRFASAEVALSGHHAAKAGPCHTSVACDAEAFASESRAVAYFQAVEGGLMFSCTGSLVGDTDASTTIPWFVTANHCVVNEAVARTLECFWDFRSHSCGGFIPSLAFRPRTSGATLIATSYRVDTSFLRLTGRLPSNRFFPGFNVGLVPAGAEVFSVHHPASAHMRISYGEMEQRRTDYLDVQWDSGVTEPGSSGAPLYNASRQLVGVLSGGFSACNTPLGFDQYGRFDRAFTLLDLDTYLLAGNASDIGDEWDPFDDFVSGATLVPLPIDGTVVSGPHSLDGTDVGDWLRFELERGGTYTFTSDLADGLHAALFRGLDASRAIFYRGAPAFPVTFRAPRSATYWLRVRSVGGAQVESYSVTAELTTVAPVPVTDLTTGTDRRGRVTLRWRDERGNATRYDIERQDGDEWVSVGSSLRRGFRQSPGPGTGQYRYRVVAHNPAGDAAAEVDVTVVGVGDDALDPVDDDPLGATVLDASGGAATGRSLSGTDLVDWYRIDLSAGQSIVLETSGRGDPDADLFGPDDVVVPIAEDRNSGRRRNFSLSFTATEPGPHWLRVRASRPGRRLRYELTLLAQ